MSQDATTLRTTPDADVAYLGVAALTDAFRRRALSPVEVAALLIARIERLDPRVNAIVHVDPDYARAMARAA